MIRNSGLGNSPRERDLLGRADLTDVEDGGRRVGPHGDIVCGTWDEINDSVRARGCGRDGYNISVCVGFVAYSQVVFTFRQPHTSSITVCEMAHAGKESCGLLTILGILG